jgi:hypothetical protein
LFVIKDERPVQAGQPLVCICLIGFYRFDLLPGWRENSHASGKTVPLAGIKIPGITLGVETNLLSISETISVQHYHTLACLYVSKTMQK